MICQERSALSTPPCIFMVSGTWEDTFCHIPKTGGRISSMRITVSMSWCLSVTWIIIWCSTMCWTLLRVPGFVYLVYILSCGIYGTTFSCGRYGMQCKRFFQKLEVFLFCLPCYLTSVLMNVGLHHITFSVACCISF